MVIRDGHLVCSVGSVVDPFIGEYFSAIYPGPNDFHDAEKS